MRVERVEDGWVVCKGRDRVSRFCFYVDGYKSCWTTRQYGEDMKFPTREAAEIAIDELKLRAYARTHQLSD